MRNDPIEQFPFRRKFQNEIHSITLLKRILQAENVWVVDAHENCNLLLQSLSILSLGFTRALFEPLDRIVYARGPFNTTVYGRKVALAQLLKDAILLSEPVCVSRLWVAEYEPRFIQNSYFVSVLQFPTLIAANNGFIDERPIAGEVLQDRD